MNSLNLFVLIIVLIVLVYILYYFFLSTTTNVNTTLLNLNSAVPPYTKLAAPTNARYAYGAWVYVNNLGSSNNPASNVIFSRNVNGPFHNTPTNFSLYITPGAPVLNCDLGMNDGSLQTTVITNNFPLQKWCFIIISVDGQFVDYYLNGKLIKSEKKNALLKVPSSDTTGTPLYLGTAGFAPFIPFDAYLGKVIQWTTPIDPQTAWSTYLNGNGIGSAISPYHANLSILKDNVTTSTYQLW